MFSGFEDAKKEDGSPVAGFSAPAYYKSKWCVDDSDGDGREEDTGLAGVGTKGAQGAKNTDEAARNEAANWVWAAYAQLDPKSKVKIGKAKPFTTKSGLSGSVAQATALSWPTRRSATATGSRSRSPSRTPRATSPPGSSTPPPASRTSCRTPPSSRS